MLLHTLLRMSVATLMLLLMVACASPPSIKDSSVVTGYDGFLKKSVLVIVDTGHLDKAFSHNRELTRQQILEQVNSAADAFSNQVKAEIKVNGIESLVRVINTNTDFQGVQKVLAQHRNFGQVLVINVDTFGTQIRLVGGQASGPPVWTGNLTWRLWLFDYDQKAIQSHVWSAVTTPSFFTRSYCGSDAFKSCAHKVVALLVSRMREDKIIRAY